MLPLYYIQGLSTSRSNCLGVVSAFILVNNRIIDTLLLRIVVIRIEIWILLRWTYESFFWRYPID